MGARYAASRSTVAIVAAVLAACGGAIAVTSNDEGDGDGTAPSPDPRSDFGAAAAASAGTYAAGRCPPPNDPYWDQVFGGSWGDASVCGVTEAGADRNATVDRDLACAVSVHPESQVNQYKLSGCDLPAAISV